MTFAVEVVAQATATAGYNIADGKWWQTSRFPRKITKIGLTGSAVAQDCVIEIAYGSIKVAEYRNTLGGAASATVGLSPTHMQEVNIPGCPGGTPINVTVKTQPTTNPIQFGIDIVDFTRQRY